jgi:hypothetical protein
MGLRCLTMEQCTFCGDPKKFFQLMRPDYCYIKDNRDHKAVPQFESVLGEDNSLLVKLYEYNHPDLPWLYERHKIEETCGFVFGEPMDQSPLTRLRIDFKGKRTPTTLSELEEELGEIWMIIDGIVLEFFVEPIIPTPYTPGWFEAITGWLAEHGSNTFFWDAPKEKFNAPVDEQIMPTDGGLKNMYGTLEVVQTTWRLCEAVKAELKKSNSKWKHRLQIKTVEACAKEAKFCHQRMGDVADSWIGALKGRGVNSILAQARWGSTGEALRQLMTDVQQRQYAQEYVESAIETLQGVKMVKLK